MIFGDTATLAIEIAPLPDNDTIWHRGAMVGIWIGGERLGDVEASEPLGPLATRIQAFLDSREERHGGPFVNLETSQIISAVTTDASADLSWFDQIAMKGLNRYLMADVGSLQTYQLIGIRYDRSERLIWSVEGEISETFLSTKQVEAALSDFLIYEADLRG